MPTIRDIAKQAGVSPASVCRVLAQEPSFKVSDQTRERILSCAAELGYQYNPRKRTPEPLRFGFVLSMTAKKYSDPFFTDILAAVEEECLNHNATISQVRNYDELRHPEVLASMCNELSGLILCEDLPKEILQVLKAHIPHIVVADLPDSEFDCVGFDYYAANMQVMNLLLSKGYRRIAYIGGPTPGIDFQRSVRMAIYRDSLFCAGIPYDPALTRNCNWELEPCQQHTQELMSMENPPDVIFAGSDSLAVVVLNTLLKMGIRCPDDVGVIGFNNVDISAHTFPPLTTVDIPEKEIGIELVRHLVAAVNGEPCVLKTTLFRTRIIERASLRDMHT